MRSRLSFMLMLTCLFLAACGGGGSTNPPTDAPSSDSAASSNAASTPFQSEVVHYTVTLSGGYTLQAEGAADVLVFSTTPPRRLISFAGPGMEVQALLQMPYNIQPGEYDLSDSSQFVAQVSTDFSTEDESFYSQDVTGRLTIDSADPLTGSFEYTVHNPSGTAVTATGNFNEAQSVLDIEVTGAQEVSIPPGVAYLTRMNGVAGSLTLTNGTSSIAGGETFSLTLYFPDEIAPGEHRITAFADFISDSVRVIISNVEDGYDYDANVEGTITLTEVGDELSGSFTLTGASMADESQVVNITGSFENVAAIGAEEIEG